uniref:PilX N-terminal domain-containing pilus assembly protein n=1 Tax=Marinobacterium profundum TaxID=1714300 RepID=UPI000AF8BAB6|nr:PilX N-terminal domain-containing pilus assembly protein [Marinobacterium profundum]
MQRRQMGAATLFITIIILALLTVIAAVSAKIGMFELKTSANSNRAKEALHAAQGGLDYGAIRYLNDASWAGESLDMPFGGPGASVSVSAIVGADSIVLNAVGESVDTTGLARVEEKFARLPILKVGDLPPLMANGNFPDSGSFSIVTNPNGGGTGVPVSGWVEDATKTGGASWQTCNVDEWLYESNNATQGKLPQSDGFVLCHTCRCDKAINKICDAGAVVDTNDCPDIVVGLPIIDAFQNLFGFDPEDTDGNGVDDWYEFMDAFATVRLTSCASLGPNTGDQFYKNGVVQSLPIVWVTGTCSLPGGSVGSYDTPFILFVHGELTINGGGIFYGIAFGFSDKYGGDTENFIVKVTGGPTLYGVLMTNREVDKPSGNFGLVYSQKLLEKLTNVNDTFYELARYPGSWTDTK